MTRRDSTQAMPFDLGAASVVADALDADRFVGEVGAVMTELRGASDAKAKRELGWRPAHPSWRRGFVAA
jgi:hypothetical protein